MPHFEFFTSPLSYNLLPSIHVSLGMNERTGKAGAAIVCIGWLCWNAVTAFPFDGDSGESR